MENGTLGLVDAMQLANTDCLVTAGRLDTSKTKSSLDQLASNNNYSENSNENDDNVLSSVLMQVRHAYILPPATSAHGTINVRFAEGRGGLGWVCWLGGSVVERRSLAGEHSLVFTGPAADG